MRHSNLFSLDKEQISTQICFISSEETEILFESSLTFLGIIKWFWLDACHINDIVPK